MSSDSSPASVAEVTPCPDCGHMVPPMNMTVHRALACRGRARPVNNTYQQSRVARNGSDNDNGDDIICVDENRPPSRKRSGNSHNDARPKGMPKRDHSNGGGENEDVEMVDLIEQLEREEAEEERLRSRGSSRNSPIDVDDSSSGDEQVVAVDNHQWACPRCTLLNPTQAVVCNACHFANPHAPSPFSVDHSNRAADVARVRPPDAVRSERLIDPTTGYRGNGSPGAAAMVGGGALLGGVLGGAASWARGRPVSSGVLEGAISGAASGAFFNEVMRDNSNNSASRHNSATSAYQQLQYAAYNNDNNAHQLSEARSAGANGLPAYPVMNGMDAPRRSSRRPRPSLRVVRQMNADGVTTTAVSSAAGGGATRIIRRRGTAEQDPMLSLLLHSMIMGDPGVGPGGSHFVMPFGGGGGGNNIDGMSYEQLLAAFGDGTENLGASEETITSLPTAKVDINTVTGKAKLPDDACQCSICLEDFEGGQTRKTLPCLHGFHGDCVDKWLRSNAACPVCKFRLDGSGS